MSLKLENFCVNVADKNILHSVNYSFDSGLYILIGKNGVGKTSFARALIGEVQNTGKIFLDDKNVTNDGITERAKSGIFLAYQNPPEISGLTIKKFFGMLAKNNSYNESIDDLFERFGLDKEFMTRYVNHKFSGGEKKKLELIQMLIIKPKVAILDEIDSGVDIATLKQLATVIEDYSKENTVLLITHSKQFLEYFKPKKIVLFNNFTLNEIKKEKLKEIEENGFDGAGVDAQ